MTGCHHPPFILTVDPGQRLKESQHQAIEHTAIRAAANPTNPVVFVGEALAVTVEVVECSWCRRPWRPEPEADVQQPAREAQVDIDRRLAEAFPCPTCSTGSIRRGETCPRCNA